MWWRQCKGPAKHTWQGSVKGGNTCGGFSEREEQNLVVGVSEMEEQNLVVGVKVREE